MTIEFKKDYIDGGVINRQFFIKNPIDNELEEVLMLAHIMVIKNQIRQRWINAWNNQEHQVAIKIGGTTVIDDNFEVINVQDTQGSYDDLHSTVVTTTNNVNFTTPVMTCTL